MVYDPWNFPENKRARLMEAIKAGVFLGAFVLVALSPFLVTVWKIVFA